MIDGLDDALRDCAEPGRDELRGVLREVLDGRRVAGRYLGEQTLKRTGNVYRLRFDIGAVLALSSSSA
jgi:hypothetical protein